MLWLQQHFYYSLFWLFIINLAIGSLLNVIIYRLPVMLKDKWREQCQEFLKTLTEKIQQQQPMFNLAWPTSHCTTCKKKLKPWHNVPLLSYIFLRGRCAYCEAIISWQYPAVELLTAALSIWAAFHFGLSYQYLFFLLLTYALISLTFIDLNHQLLPDDITLPFLWLGLLCNLFGLFATLPDAVIGAVAGYLSLWIFNYLFRLIRKKDGMGHGDFKLFALFGAWLGWQFLPLILLIAAGSGAIIGILLIITKKLDRENPIPFGPYLAIAGWIVALWGPQILNWYR